MKQFIKNSALLCFLAISLLGLVACSSDTEKSTTTESTEVVSKESSTDKTEASKKKEDEEKKTRESKEKAEAELKQQEAKKKAEEERIAKEKLEAEQKQAEAQQEATTQQAVAEAPAQVPTPTVGPFRNCAEARAAGVTPIYEGQAGYAPHLDRDHDGVACE